MGNLAKISKATEPSLASRLALWVFLGLLAYMPLHIFLSTWIGTSFAVLPFAKVAKDGVLVTGTLLALAASWRQPFLRKLLSDRLVWLILAFGFLNLLLVLLRPTDQEAELLGFVYNVRFLLFFLYALLLANLFSLADIVRKAVRVVLTAGAVVIVFGIVQYTVLPDDALTHVGYSRETGVLPAFFIDDKPDLERIMSTLRDPNSLGSYLIILTSLLVSMILFAKRGKLTKKQKDRALFLGGWALLALLCLLWTFSRSAWFGAAGATAFLFGVYTRQHISWLTPKRQKLLAVGLLTTVLVAAGTLFAFRNTYFVQNVVFHADESTVLEDPNQLRMRFWQESVQDIADQPLGSGPGTAGLSSIRNEEQGTVLNENYYLQMAQETGLVGATLFIAILLAVVLRLRKSVSQYPAVANALLASFIGLAVTNFLLHIWANEAVAYTWWGLAGLVISCKPRVGAEHTK
jgi:O-antigen ligase